MTDKDLLSLRDGFVLLFHAYMEQSRYDKRSKEAKVIDRSLDAFNSRWMGMLAKEPAKYKIK